MSVLAARAHTFPDPALWREKLGIEALLTLLTARVSALETALDQLQAAPAAVVVTTPSLDVLDVDGVAVLSQTEVALADAQPLLLESPEEGKFYRVQPFHADDGSLNFDLVQADTLTASDGRRWRLTVQLVDGVPNLADPELLS